MRRQHTTTTKIGNLQCGVEWRRDCPRKFTCPRIHSGERPGDPILRMSPSKRVHATPNWKYGLRSSSLPDTSGSYNPASKYELRSTPSVAKQNIRHVVEKDIDTLQRIESKEEKGEIMSTDVTHGKELFTVLHNQTTVIKKREETLKPVIGKDQYYKTGLRNIGNTCYMNVVIQCLANTELLFKLLTENIRTSPAVKSNSVSSELVFLLTVLKTGEYRSVTPLDFKEAVDNICPIFSESKQQDAQEFLVNLLDQIDRELEQTKREVERKEDSQRVETIETDKNESEKLNKMKSKQKSIMDEVFGGIWSTKVECPNCGKNSISVTPFRFLHLHLPEEGETTLAECLDSYREAELIDDWKCGTPASENDRNKKSFKTYRIKGEPEVLIITLKRFGVGGLWNRKVETFVDIPNILSLEKFRTCCNDQVCSYELYSLITHQGDQQSGHYVAQCQDSTNRGFWHYYDEQEISSTSNHVRKEGAYILFYRKSTVRTGAESTEADSQRENEENAEIQQNLGPRRTMFKNRNESIINNEKHQGNEISIQFNSIQFKR